MLATSIYHRRPLFADVSLDPVRGMGVALTLLSQPHYWKLPPAALFALNWQNSWFEGTSSTTLEVQTILWALEDHRTVSAGLVTKNLQVYSDSQCIAGLLKRRTGLTDRSFRGRGTDRELRNASLYRRFYELYDELGFEITKVKGHTGHFSRNAVQEVFSYLDRQVRKALRLWLEELGTACRK